VFHPNGDPLEPKRFRSTQVEYLMDKIMKNSLTLRQMQLIENRSVCMLWKISVKSICQLLLAIITVYLWNFRFMKMPIVKILDVRNKISYR